MRLPVFVLLAVAAVVGACVVQDEPPAASPVVGCLPLRDAVPALGGELRSIALADGGALLVADQTVQGGGFVSFTLGGGARDDCSGWTASAPRPVWPPSDDLFVPLDLVATPRGLALFYERFAFDAAAPLGLRAIGTGVGLYDATERFTPGAPMWNADLPNYGTSAVLDGDFVYAFGCAARDAFDADCFVARAPAARLDDAAAYAYFDGATWSSDTKRATPIAGAGTRVSVRRDPRGHLVMTYVPPLGRTLEVRTAAAPEGPWSERRTLGECDLADAGDGAFCAGGEQHPELARDRLVVSFHAATFGDAGPSWPRIAGFPPP